MYQFLMGFASVPRDPITFVQNSCLHLDIESNDLTFSHENDIIPGIWDVKVFQNVLHKR